MRCTTWNVTATNFNKTIEEVKAFLSGKGDREATLSFSGGLYNLTEPVLLDAAQLKAADPGKCRLRLLGGGRKKQIFSALTEIPGSLFTAVPEKPYYVYQFGKDAEGNYPNLRAVYANGQLCDVSRTSEYRSTEYFHTEAKTYDVKQSNWETEYGHRLYVPIESVLEAGIENCRGAELHIRVEWEYKIYHIDYVDTEDVYIDPNGNKHVAIQLRKDEKKDGNGVLSVCSRVFFICNTTSVLTTPGQYAYVRSDGKLYFYPEKEIGEYTFGIGRCTSLFTFRNFDALTIRGLQFTGIEDDILTNTGFYAAHQAGSWGGHFKNNFPHAGAVRVENANEMDLDECRFIDLPCDALAVYGALDNITVRNSRFEHIGGTAIRVGRPVPYSEENHIRNLVIENNYLDDIGFTYENCCSIQATYVRDGRLNHNTVLRSAYSAFSLGWKWDKAEWSYGEKVNLEHVEVAYNFIKSFVTKMRDGGGIYTLGGNVEVHGHWAFINSVHDNVVVEDEETCPENGFFASLYHDGASSNWHNYNNIVIHNPKRNGPSGRIYLQGAWAGAFIGSTELQASWHILSENNYLCCCDDFGVIYRSQDFDPVKASDMLDYTRDNREKDTHMLKNTNELEKYPEALRILHYSGCEAKIGEKPRHLPNSRILVQTIYGK